MYHNSKIIATSKYSVTIGAQYDWRKENKIQEIFQNYQEMPKI